MAGVPHLNELNTKYRPRGMELLSVSDENEGLVKVPKFIQEKKVAYGVAWAPKEEMSAKYGVRAYPSAWLLDIDGKVIWAGNPGRIPEETIEAALKDMPPGSAALAAGDYKTAEEEVAAAKKAKDKRFEYVENLLERRLAARKAVIEETRKCKDTMKLVALLEEDAKAYAHNDYGKKCGEEAKQVRNGRDYKDCEKAQEALDKLKPKINDMKEDKAKKALEKIARDYPNTPAGKEAAELAKDFS